MDNDLTIKRIYWDGEKLVEKTISPDEFYLTPEEIEIARLTTALAAAQAEIAELRHSYAGLVKMVEMRRPYEVIITAIKLGAEKDKP